MSISIIKGKYRLFSLVNLICLFLFLFLFISSSHALVFGYRDRSKVVRDIPLVTAGPKLGNLLQRGLSEYTITTPFVVNNAGQVLIITSDAVNSPYGGRKNVAATTTDASAAWTGDIPLFALKPTTPSSSPGYTAEPTGPASSSAAALGPAGSDRKLMQVQSSGMKKKGIAYNDGNLVKLFQPVSGWGFNWEAVPRFTVPDTFQYIPSLQCVPDAAGIQAWKTQSEAAKQMGSKYAFSFNEPDISNNYVDPKIAADSYKMNMVPMRSQGWQIGSPGISSGGHFSPPWLKSFLENLGCTKANPKDCPVDFANLHWYPDPKNVNYATVADDFIKYINELILFLAGYGITRIFVGEFGIMQTDWHTCVNTQDAANFITKTVKFLESTDAIIGYAYFMVNEGNLVKGGVVDPLIGKAYYDAS